MAVPRVRAKYVRHLGAAQNGCGEDSAWLEIFPSGSFADRGMAFRLLLTGWRAAVMPCHPIVIPAGAVLDVPVSMKPATCKVLDFSPANSTEPVETTAGNPPVHAQKLPARVLVVDDEPLIRWSISESLTDLGLDVAQAADAASALRKVTTATLPFQVVVLDLRLPDMHDLSLLSTLRQLLPHARLVLMTAFGTDDVFAQAELIGAEVLNKPFELEQLARLVLDDRKLPR
jgi:CheY-like chemotaxis protein